MLFLGLVSPWDCNQVLSCSLCCCQLPLGKTEHL